MSSSLSFLVLVLFGFSVESAKILVIFHAPAPSHNILGSALAKGLAEAGHDITYVSSFPEKNPPKNGSYRVVELTGMDETFKKLRSGGSKRPNLFDSFNGNVFLTAGFMLPKMEQMCELALAHENFQTLIKSGEQFDSVITEQFMNDCFKPLVPHFGAKAAILFSPVGANNWVNPLVGNPSPLSYIPEIFLSYSSHMTFFERTINLLFHGYTQFIYHFISYPNHNRVAQKYISPNANIYNELYNSSLILLNSHPSSNQPVPNVPSMVNIGGFHVKPPKKLPEDLQKFLDEAKDGVIYFSMGSNLRSADLAPEKRDALLKVFSKLKQKILWKWEEETMPGQPANVKFGKWLPQADLLAHPNIKLFITHGGLLSTTETIYHGVPILAIPIFGDQKINAKNSVDNGIGQYLYYDHITEENLLAKINELLKNPKYRQNAKNRAAIFHDRLTSPMETLVYWVEYVIRHNGAPHLKVAGVELPWYQYHLLDVFAFLACAMTLIVYIQIVIVRKICRKFCKKCQVNKKPAMKLKKN